MSFTATSRALSQPETFTSDVEQKIRYRAYELYLLRGQQPGDAIQDWLQAEAELKSAPNPSVTAAKTRAAKPRSGARKKF